MPFQPLSTQPAENLRGNPLPEPLQERLNRQVEKMKNSFKPHPQNRTLPTLGAESMLSICSKLADLFSLSSTRIWGQIQADRGLLLVGLRRRGNSLYERLASQSAAINGENLARSAEAARKIVDRSVADNSLHIGWLGYPARIRYRLLRGMQPIFWWPLSSEVREALIFKQFLVMTVYNPAFLISDLRRLGLEVMAQKSGEIRVSKQRDEKRYEVLGMSYFLALAREHLVSDTAIARIIAKCVEAVENAGFSSSTSINMDLRFNYD